MRIIADLHVQVRRGPAEGPVAAQVSAALVRGLEAVALFAPHSPAALPVLRAVRAIDARTPTLRVLSGVSCRILSPEGDLRLHTRAGREHDLVLAVAAPQVATALARWVPRYRPAARRALTDAVVAAVYRHDVDLVALPARPEVDPAEVARALRDRGVALEVCARRPRPPAALLRQLARLGVRFAVTSGAGRPEEVGDCGAAVALLAAAGVPPEQVVNSDRGGLTEWLAARRRLSDPGGWADWSRQGGTEGRERPGGRERRPGDWADWSAQGGEIH
ncbi:histidinol-phosphatase [Symbiobacterium thermophilum]|uniref:Histidinol phosphatase and related hydrolases of PHP family n=1 Tax=Symbiobacterium thermophilum (strain DSM 24528 / JCM 14929 / IAM 14863 / T) TaxID=292459 RepID=Q67T23_SYMTH|nr:histidinol-phosphatase [Symbiobacterium thermophilum]BAD39170.1 histidinol phosphatase and related hydrolases of PHP family [Symbiobacterium thermophilum IAM 14863]